MIWLGQEGVAVCHLALNHRLHASEQLLMLQLLIRQPHQRFERHLIAEGMMARKLQRLRADEPFDQREHVRVGPALYL